MTAQKTTPKIRTKQAVFNKVTKHLLTQDKKSVLPSTADEWPTCAYHGPGGLRCAVGCLIPWTVDTGELECTDVATALRIAPELFRRLGISEGCHRDLLVDLQAVHDDKHPRDWPTALMGVAVDHDLDVPAALRAAC